jgi:hypothetical protein
MSAVASLILESGQQFFSSLFSGSIPEDMEDRFHFFVTQFFGAADPNCYAASNDFLIFGELRQTEYSTKREHRVTQSW